MAHRLLSLPRQQAKTKWIHSPPFRSLPAAGQKHRLEKLGIRLVPQSVGRWQDDVGDGTIMIWVSLAPRRQIPRPAPNSTAARLLPARWTWNAICLALRRASVDAHVARRRRSPYLRALDGSRKGELAVLTLSRLDAAADESDDSTRWTRRRPVSMMGNIPTALILLL